ncbi:MAG TPA: hypothetical protein VLD55_02610 [Candidatus Sulfobium mesophilum]|nr:hypothetical protein [Candidatus Sulfobium mesophilum]
MAAREILSVILLGGVLRRHKARDVRKAQSMWAQYKEGKEKSQVRRYYAYYKRISKDNFEPCRKRCRLSQTPADRQLKARN